MKAIIFDMDGVLIDSERVSLECFKKAAKIHGVELDIDLYMSTIGQNAKTCDETYMRCFKDRELLTNAKITYKNLFKEESDNGRIPLKKGAREIIASLKNNNYPYALATSSARPYVEMAFINQGYSEVPFKYIMTGDKINNSKPDPEIFIKAAEMMGVDVKDCLIVEDSLNGIKAAYNAKATSCLVPDIVEPNEEMLNKANYIKKDLLEVLELIKNNLVQ